MMNDEMRLNIQHSAFNIQHSAFSIQHSAFSIQPLAPNFRHPNGLTP